MDRREKEILVYCEQKYMEKKNMEYFAYCWILRRHTFRLNILVGFGWIAGWLVTVHRHISSLLLKMLSKGKIQPDENHRKTQ